VPWSLLTVWWRSLRTIISRDVKNAGIGSLKPIQGSNRFP
jgi:hypothetical protein